MKKLLLLTLILSGLILQATAQNYQSFNSGRIASYEDQWDEIKFVRIDSAYFQTDSVLIPFGGFQEVSFECYIIDGPSWLGKEIIVQDNGLNLFVTSEEGTVHINTAAMQGDSWTAFQRPGELIITATVLSHDLQTFLGLQDSVKTIGFQAYDYQMQPITHDVNAMTMAVSKNYGFVRTLNFALFPDLTTSFGNETDGLREFEIAGMSDPQVGVQNFTWMEVHDFQPGDEIHVYHYEYRVPAYTIEIRQTIKKYLAREDQADSVSYTIERIMSKHFEDINGSTYLFIHDTITETFSPDENFDKLPGEIVKDEWDIGAYYHKMETQWYPAKIQPSIEYWLFYAGDNCWNPMFVDDCAPEYKWYKGLGGPYLYCYLWGHIESYPVYYKKGNETWGDPLVIVGMEEKQSGNGINIYPNPATDKLWIMCEDADLPLTVEFYDLHGRLFKTAVVTETGQQIGLQEFKPGMYLYRISSADGLISQGKIVVE